MERLENAPGEHPSRKRSVPGDPAAAITVREMAPQDVDIRIRYFHDAPDEYLGLLGVERALLPRQDAWRDSYQMDYERPLPERENYALLWELDDEPVGFSTLDRISYGNHAFMHLHITQEPKRRRGLGTQFVVKSTNVYFDMFELKRLYCEPNALNVAPNRTLQRAGFTYLFSHDVVPGPINLRQVTTRWVLERHR
jgi:RimJ/RimL family protein N-acetyltransferase